MAAYHVIEPPIPFLIPIEEDTYIPFRNTLPDGVRLIDEVIEQRAADDAARVKWINRESSRLWGVSGLGASLPRIPSELFPHAQPDEWEFVD